MAREITGIRIEQPDGSVVVEMLYVFAISPRVVDGDGVEVVPAFDPSGIPAHLASQLLQTQLDAVASGDAGWVLRRGLNKGLGESDAQFVARAQTDYALKVVYEIQRARDRAIEANDFDRRRFQLSV